MRYLHQNKYAKERRYSCETCQTSHLYSRFMFYIKNGKNMRNITLHMCFFKFKEKNQNKKITKHILLGMQPSIRCWYMFPFPYFKNKRRSDASWHWRCIRFWRKMSVNFFCNILFMLYFMFKFTKVRHRTINRLRCYTNVTFFD